jgi:Ca2+-binding EF-hand superfamily protein
MKILKYIESLNLQEFIDALKAIPYLANFETNLIKFFHKIDSNNTGYISWDDLCNLINQNKPFTN